MVGGPAMNFPTKQTLNHASCTSQRDQSTRPVAFHPLLMSAFYEWKPAVAFDHTGPNLIHLPNARFFGSDDAVPPKPLEFLMSTRRSSKKRPRAHCRIARHPSITSRIPTTSSANLNSNVAAAGVEKTLQWANAPVIQMDYLVHRRLAI